MTFGNIGLRVIMLDWQEIRFGHAQSTKPWESAQEYKGLSSRLPLPNELEKQNRACDRGVQGIDLPVHRDMNRGDFLGLPAVLEPISLASDDDRRFFGETNLGIVRAVFSPRRIAADRAFAKPLAQVTRARYGDRNGKHRSETRSDRIGIPYLADRIAYEHRRCAGRIGRSQCGSEISGFFKSIQDQIKLPLWAPS